MSKSPRVPDRLFRSSKKYTELDREPTHEAYSEDGRRPFEAHVVVFLVIYMTIFQRHCRFWRQSFDCEQHHTQTTNRTSTKNHNTERDTQRQAHSISRCMDRGINPAENIFSQAFHIYPIIFSDRFYHQPDEKILLRPEIRGSWQKTFFSSRDFVAPALYPISIGAGYWSLRSWQPHHVYPPSRERESGQFSLQPSIRQEFTSISLDFSSQAASGRENTCIPVNYQHVVMVTALQQRFWVHWHRDAGSHRLKFLT